MRYLFPAYCVLLLSLSLFGSGLLQSACAMSATLAMVTVITWVKWLPRWTQKLFTLPVVALCADAALFYLGMTHLDGVTAKATFVAWHGFVSTGLVWEHFRLHPRTSWQPSR